MTYTDVECTSVSFLNHLMGMTLMITRFLLVTGCFNIILHVREKETGTACCWPASINSPCPMCASQKQTVGYYTHSKLILFIAKLLLNK